MEENIKNEIVEKAADAMIEAAENLDKAIAETGVKPASALTELATPASNTGKTVAIGVGAFLGGAAVGYAVDRWVAPKLEAAFRKAKEKRAAKKAEKAAKKAAKAAAKNQEKKPEQAPAAPATNDGVDPTTIDTTIKD